MATLVGNVRGRISLIATSSLWVAGFQGMFGDPCGVQAAVVTLNEALALKGPRIVLIDVSATSIHGRLREVLIQFREWARELKPIVISHEATDDDAYIEGLIRAGAKGYLSASASPEEFSVALENVREGSIWAPRKVLSRLVQSQAGADRRMEDSSLGAVRFTPREDQVIHMLVDGQCNRDIGISLGIDPVTVKAHLGRIMRKAGVINRIELTMFALNLQKSEEGKRRSRGELRSNRQADQPTSFSAAVTK